MPFDAKSMTSMWYTIHIHTSLWKCDMIQINKVYVIHNPHTHMTHTWHIHLHHLSFLYWWPKRLLHTHYLQGTFWRGGRESLEKIQIPLLEVQAAEICFGHRVSLLLVDRVASLPRVSLLPWQLRVTWHSARQIKVRRVSDLPRVT